MLANYLKIALRNIIRSKLFSFINIIGLAVGMAGTLMIMSYVMGELSFENFHKNKDRIYRVATDFGQVGSKMPFAGAMPALGPAMKEQIPEVENSVRIQWDPSARIKFEEKSFIERNFFFADESVFDIFSFSLIRGAEETVLEEPFNMVLSERIAAKYFGDTDPIGKTLLYEGESAITVTGLIEDVPANTHLRCDFIVSYSTLEAIGLSSKNPWNQTGSDFTYILLEKNSSPDALVGKMDKLLRENAGDFFADLITFRLQPLTKIHMISDAIIDIGPKGNMTYIYVFSSMAFLLLLIACFNFVNLSTAKYQSRAKEVGMRKMVGATRFQLIKQFLMESVCTALLAIMFALLLYELCYPKLLSFLAADALIEQQNMTNLFIIIPAVVIAVGLLAGSYPAFFLSRYAPADVFKGNYPAIGGRPKIRRMLVIAQFAMAVMIISVTGILFKQIDFMKDTDLGFVKEDVVVFNCPQPEHSGKNIYPLLKEQFLKHPDVLSVSGTYTIPGIISKETKTVSLEGVDDKRQVTMQAMAVDHSFPETLGLDLVKGRGFSRAISLDESESVIINEEAVRTLDLKKPLGSRLLVSMKGGAMPMTVVGVVRNFHVYSLREKIEPLVLYINPERYNLIAVRIGPQNTAGAISHLEEKWNSIVPDVPFGYSYLENIYNRLYISEEKLGKLLILFSSLAIFLTLLGLFGLAAFVSQRRNREISIRRVLGASIPDVFYLLIKDFTKWLLIAILVAWPFAYYAGHSWLQDFAYRTGASWYIFVFAGAASMIIALLTISFQVIKVSILNPVETLRHE